MAAPEPDPASPEEPAVPPSESAGSAARPSGLAPATGPARRTDPAAPPALRASDADRERTATLLRDAAGDGRLTVDELDERLGATYAAITHDDLDGLTTDLVAAPHHRPAPRTAGAGDRVVVRDADDGTRWLVAIMGGVERRGQWRLGRRCTSLSIMGGADLDLTDVQFDGQDVHLRVFAVMGGAEIRVPEHMNVVVSDIGLMGGHDVDIGPTTPDPGGPTLHLHLIAVMGGSSVRRGPRISRRERRERRDDERRSRHELRHLERHGLPRHERREDEGRR